MRSRTLPTAFMSAVVAALACGSATAADLQRPLPPSPSLQPMSEWRFQATAYGWLTAIDGDIGVRDLPTTPFDASLSDVLDHLDGAVMGSFFASNGQWLFLADLVLAKLSSARDVLDADISQTVASGAIGYWLPLGTPGFEFAVTGGLRYVRLSADVSLSPAGLPLSVSASQSESWIDPTVGFAARWAINDKWFVNATADIGGFGVGSKLSSNGYVGLGYMWTPSVSTAIGYRYLYEDYATSSGNGSFRYNATMHGPTISLAWHF